MKLNRIIAIAFVSNLILSSQTNAQNPLQVELDATQVMHLAQERQIDILVSNERVQQAMSQLNQAKSAFFPQVNASFSQSRETRNLEAVGLQGGLFKSFVGPFNSYDLRLSITQTLFDLTVLKRFEAAKEGKEQSIAERLKIKQDALALMASIYVEARRAASSIEWIQSVEKMQQKELEIAQVRFNQGIGSELEIKQANASYLQSVEQLKQAELLAYNKKLDLAAALGFPNEASFIFKPEPTEILKPSGDEIQKALENHPEIKSVQKLLAQRKAERWVALAEFLPKITGFYDIGPSGVKPTDAKPAYEFGIKASVPLFEGGKRVFETQEAESRVREAKARLQDVQRHVQARALSAMQSLEQALSMVDSAEAEWASELLQKKLADNRLETGIGSELDQLQAASNEAMARNGQEEAQATYHLAQIELLHALGKMEQWGEAPQGKENEKK